MVSHKPFLQDWLVVTAGSNCGQRQTAGVLGLRSFTKSYFNAPTAASAPWTNSKGSDTMMLLEFLEWLVTLHLRDPADYLKPHEPMFGFVENCCEKQFGDVQGCIQTPTLGASRMCTASVLQCYGSGRGLQTSCPVLLGVGSCRVPIKTQTTCSPPHSVILWRLSFKNLPRKWWNWVAYACEMNEDHIGHTARMS